ncbi:hypothetical protein P8452_32606 [Trifolium repens]|nr:hypothetical protein P8452_32606 [Trifolium repens]
MVDVAVVDSRAKAINTNQFYKAFWPVMGKSMILFSEVVLKYFYDNGVHIAASKVVKKRLESRGKEVVVQNLVNHIHTTEEVLDKYVSAAVSTMPAEDVGCSSGSKRSKV